MSRADLGDAPSQQSQPNGFAVVKGDVRTGSIQGIARQEVHAAVFCESVPDGLQVSLRNFDLRFSFFNRPSFLGLRPSSW